MYQKIRIAVFSISMFFFPLTFYYISPYLPIMGAIEGVVSGSLILFCFLFISSTFLGRFFCSWLCPAGAIQDVLTQVNNKKIIIKYISWIKYLVWIPWIILVILLFIQSGGIKNLNFFYQTEYGISMTKPEAALLYGFIIFIFILLSLVFGRRTACHSICWISPFMIIGKKIGQIIKIPQFKIKVDQGKCISCGKCTEVCPMCLDVQTLVKQGDIKDLNCILCGKCLDSCKLNILSIGK